MLGLASPSRELFSTLCQTNQTTQEWVTFYHFAAKDLSQGEMASNESPSPSLLKGACGVGLRNGGLCLLCYLSP
jgi:hypothetical protein